MFLTRATFLATLLLLNACHPPSQGIDAGSNPCGAVGQECCFFTNNSCNPGLMCVGGEVCLPPDIVTDAGPGDGGLDGGVQDAGSDVSTDGGLDGGTDAGAAVDAGEAACGCDPELGCSPCSDAGNVICTASQTCAAPHYMTNGDGTVTDTVTGLVWQQSVSSNPCPADDGGFPAGCAWNDAAKYCQHLSLGTGSPTWRLPTLPELYSLVEGWSTPTIDPTAFPDTPGEPFWSSTSVSLGPDAGSNADVVYFNSGTTAGFDPGFDFEVRCVQ